MAFIGYGILLLVLFLAAVYLSIGIYAFVHAIRRNRYRDPEDLGEISMTRYRGREELAGEHFSFFDSLAFEELILRSEDGLLLFGRRAVPEGEVRGRILFFHGYRSCPKSDFSGIAKVFWEEGYELIFLSQRSHGRSEGRYITFGVKERYDAKAWGEEICRRYPDGKPMALVGMSMGAATVLMASALELPSAVRCVVADCGFTTPYEIISHKVKTGYHLPTKLFMPFVNFLSRRLAKVDLWEASSAEGVRSGRLPTLLIHGDDDTYVPYRMAEELRSEAAPNVSFLPVAGARHTQAFLVAEDAWRREALSLLERSFR